LSDENTLNYKQGDKVMRTFFAKIVEETQAFELYAENTNDKCGNQNGGQCANGVVCDTPVTVNSAGCSSK
jgi:hypothetical protein